MNRKFKFIIIAFLFISAIVLGYFSLKIKQQQPIAPEQEQTYHLLSPLDLRLMAIFTKPDLQKVDENFNSLPTKLAVYKIDPPLINTDQAKKIAASFGFTDEQLEQKPEKQQYRWISQQKTLIVSLREATIEYVVDLLNFPELLQKGELPSPEQDQERIASFLTENIITPPQDTQLKLRNWQYLKTRGPQFEETNQEQAQLVKFNLDLTLNDYPIITNNPQESLISVIVGPEFKIYQLRYQIPFTKADLVDNYPLKNKEVIISQLINKPQVSQLIRQDHQLATLTNYDQIRQIKLNSVDIGYFFTGNRQQYLQPIFYFGATGILPETNFTTFFVIPAVKDDYFNPGL